MVQRQQKRLEMITAAALEKAQDHLELDEMINSALGEIGLSRPKYQYGCEMDYSQAADTLECEGLNENDSTLAAKKS